MFFASNYFYAYQGALNTAKFDGPTRALNGTLEAAGAIIGALLIGYFVLDGSWLGRRNRGYLGLAVVTSMTIIVWWAFCSRLCGNVDDLIDRGLATAWRGIGLSWQVNFTRADATSANLISYHHANYKGKGTLFFFCQLFQAEA